MVTESLRISLAAPAYNEADVITSVIESWVVYLKSVPWISTFEIVICNDGSRDATGQILESLCAVYPEVRPIHFPANQGAAAALSEAIAHTTLDWVLLIDSDGQFPIENLALMVEAVERAGAKCAIGVRRLKQNSRFARFGSKSSGAICNFFHGTKYRDFNSAFKLVDGALLRSIPLEAKGFNYSTEISSKLLEREVPFIEVDIEHGPRAGGESSLRLLRGTRDRLLFVIYIGFRQLLLKYQILQRIRR